MEEDSRSSLLTLEDEDTVTDPAALEAMRMTRSMAVQALAISVQDWKDLGQGDDPSVAAPTTLEETVERLTCLLLVRIVAVMDPTKYSDLSTSTICRTALIESKAWCPQQLTPQVIKQLRTFVRYILKSYLDLPFHNYQHAYQVTVSANKLLDLMLSSDGSDTFQNKNRKARKPATFGLRKDPMSLAALIFASLIHDADHKGVTNRQMVIEDHKLARLYNDQSIHEHRSLHLAFEELLKDKYAQLRAVMFPKPDLYRCFRTLVVNAVLSTDIASPERTQISKSKWKEAFGDFQLDISSLGHNKSAGGGRRGSMTSNISMPRARGGNLAPPQNRRGSNCSVSSVVSDVTTDSFSMMQKQRVVDQHNARRQASNASMDSEPSDPADSIAEYGRAGNHMNNSSHHHQPRLRTQSDHCVRRASNESEYSDFATDSVMGYGRTGNRRRTPAGQAAMMRRRASSTHSATSDESDVSDLAADSVAGYCEGMGNKSNHGTPATMGRSNHSEFSEFSEFAADSIMGNGNRNRWTPATLGRSNHSEFSEFSEFAADSIMGNGNRKAPISRSSSGEGASLSFDGGDFATDSVALMHKREASPDRKRSPEEDAGPPRTITSSPRKQVLSRRASTGTRTSQSMTSMGGDSLPIQRRHLDGHGTTRHTDLYMSSPVDDDDSLSLTPPSSEDEYDGVVISGITLSRSFAEEVPVSPLKTPRGSSRRFMPRRASTGNVPVKFGSLTGQRINEDEVASAHAQTVDLMSVPSHHERRDVSKFRTRLSIRRSMDLSGEAIEVYSRNGSTGGISALQEPGDDGTQDFDKPDELRAAVVLELLLKAADVAHLLQSWQVMSNHVSRLFRELREAHKAGRGHDPEPYWFDNQIKILETYVTPLAIQLDEIGVFGDQVGPAFAEIAEQNKDSWLAMGFEAMDLSNME